MAIRGLQVGHVIFISLHPFQPSDLSAQTPYDASLVPFSLAAQDSLSHHT